MAYDSIKCKGYSSEGSGDDVINYVLVRMGRADIMEIRHALTFAAEHSDNYSFIRDCVGMCERLGEVLTEHTRLVNEDSDDHY